MVLVDRSEQEAFVRRRWRRLHAEARRRGGRIALFGAGQHTRWLLSVLPTDQVKDVVAVFDDRAEPGQECNGVSVVRPDSLPPGEIDLVVVSSDRYEGRLLRRAREVAAGRCRVRGIYNRRSFITERGRSVARPRFARTRRWVQTLLFAPEAQWNWAERFVRAFHRAQMRRVWHDAPQPPHFEDHRSALALWPEHRDPEFMACGTYARELMEPGCSVLDLCCGDGFYSHHFYSAVAGHIDAVDIDQEALLIARRYHQAPNIRYHRMDVLKEEFPAARYDVVVWDGALGHFGAEQIERLLLKIARAIGDHGVFSGSEDIETAESKSWDHPMALETPQRARELLAEHFTCVRLLIRSHPEACVYFRCGRDPSRLGGWTQPWQTQIPARTPGPG